MTPRMRLWGLLALFAATAGAVYWRAPGDATLPQAALRPGARHAAAPPTRAQAVEGWRSDILARPLIYPGRRAPGPAPAIAATAAPSPPPRLTGVIVSASGRRALFENAPGGGLVSVGEGDTIGPYHIRAIRSDEVVVDAPGGTQSLRPTYQNAPPGVQPGLATQHAAAGAGRTAVL